MARKILKAIGYWADGVREGLPNPVQLAPSRLVPELKDSVVRYLMTGHFYTADLGFSWCRFKCGISDERMGCGEFTDGVWVWPEGYAHYLVVHDVPLPPTFLEHMNQVQFQHTRRFYKEDYRAVCDEDHWKQWGRTAPRRGR